MFPQWQVPLVSRVLPLIELAAAWALLSRNRRRAGESLAVGLLTAFGIIHAGNLILPAAPPCGCIGTVGAATSRGAHWSMLGLCLGLVLALFGARQRSLRPVAVTTEQRR